MNDSELHRLFKALRVPGRKGDYWESFPKQVLAELRKPQMHRVPEPSRFEKLGWNAGLALSCLVACACVWQACCGPLSNVISRQQKEVRQALLHLDHNVRTVIRDEHGLQHLVEESR